MSVRDSYGALLRVPGIRAVLLVSTLVKVPIVAIPIVVTLQVVLGLGEGFGRAGLVVAAWTVGAAVGGPLQGRLMDRHGIRRVVSVAAAAQLVFWAAVPALSYRALAVGAFVAGIGTVQGFAVARLAVAGVVPDEQRHTAFAVDSITTEFAYMTGPALGVLLSTLVSPDAAVWALGAALVLAGLAFAALDPPVERRDPDAAPTATGIRDWLRVPLVCVLVAAVASTVVVGGYETAIVGSLRHLDQVSWSGLVLTACGVYSLVGGLLYGARSRRPSPYLIVGGMALAIIPVGLTDQWYWMALALLPATALCAPSFAATGDAASRLAPPGTRGVVLGSYSAALTVGNAIGAPLAGAVLDRSGPGPSFAVIGIVGLVLTAGAGLVAGRRAPSPVAARTDVPA